MTPNKILIFENDSKLRHLAESSIGERWPITYVESSLEAKKELLSTHYSLLLLDADIAERKGLEFCQELRSDARFQNIPVILMAQKSEVDQRILDFSLGADDSCSKSIEPREFLARVEASLRRSRQQYVNTAFSIANFRFDLLSQRCFLISPAEIETELVLTPIEFKFLVYFLKHENSVVSRQELMTAVWGQSISITGSTIDTHISSLRKKIQTTDHSLQTLVKKGYIFTLARSLSDF